MDGEDRELHVDGGRVVSSGSTYCSTVSVCNTACCRMRSPRVVVVVSTALQQSKTSSEISQRNAFPVLLLRQYSSMYSMKIGGRRLITGRTGEEVRC